MICKHDDCDKRACFGLKGNKAIYCGTHGKPLGMVNVSAKRCLEPECDARPTFGLILGKATHCGTHKSDDMKDVLNKRCLELECDAQPNFGLKWGKPTHCGTHGKPLGMVNVKSKRCLEPECDAQPTFGLIWSKPTHCGTHGKPLGMKDVKNKRCLELECDAIPNFGLIWGKATHCGTHGKPLDMTNVLTKRCLEPECDAIPKFGLIWGKVTHCGTHGKPLGMNDVVSKKCVTCASTRINRTYKPNCARCHFYLNPDDPRLTNYKVKEHAFMLPLAEIYPDIILDKTISGGCSKRRPDGFIECLSYSIIIEIDEDQHVGYETLCDNRRTMELFEDLGARPIIFIRLNPDSYKIDGKVVKGCFIRTKAGELKLVKKELSERFAALQEAVESAINDGIPSKELTYVKLFYSDE